MAIISAYPNPFDNQLEIQLLLKENHEVDFKLFNSTGILIYQIQMGKCYVGLNRIEINGQHLNSGLYFLKLEIEGIKSHTLKIIKK